MEKKIILLSSKGDEVAASWDVLDTAAFMHAQQVIRDKIRNGHILIDTDKNEVVKELDVNNDYMLIPQPIGG